VTVFAMSVSELDQGFIAGFLEGEAWLGVVERNAGASYSCVVSVRVRDDDQDLIEWLVALTGLGRLSRVPAVATSHPQIQWLIDTQADCVELAQLISRSGFHGRRAAELAIWSAAVDIWVNGSGESRRTTLAGMKRKLEAAHKFGNGAQAALPLPGSPRLRLGYISGLVAAEGSFLMSGARPRFSMHLRRDDRPLLELLASATEIGRIYDHTAAQPLNPSSSWVVTARRELERLLALLYEADLPGRKSTELEAWAVAVDELCSAARHGVRPRRDLLELAADRLRVSRVYRPMKRPLLRFARPDLRDRSVETLRAWAEVAPGPLSCGSYERWRRENPSSPNRGTITRAYGSWHGAMVAAGLGHRAARRGPTRAGGVAARSERREQQRARVVAAVRRFETERGRMPRAMEFFKWRLAAAPDTPSQGTVYNLFPGGWAAVLEACAAV
jgi:hypothetical protein